MAKHEIIIRENTGTTKAEAPYLPAYVKKNDLDFAALCSQAAEEAGLTETQLRAIIEGAFAEFEAMEQDAPVLIHVDGLTVELRIYGSFASSDSAFDATKNTLELTIRLDDDIKYVLANVTPTIVTDETATKVRITLVADEESPRPYEVIHGMHVFEIQGYNLVTTDVGAAVELVGEDGTVYACTVVEVVSKQKLRVQSATLLQGGDYKLVVKSRGGDAEGPLQSVFRKVKYLYIEPTPTLTGAQGAGQSAGTIKSLDTVTFTGVNLRALKTGERLMIEGSDDDFVDIVVAEDGKSMTARAGDYPPGSANVVWLAADGTTKLSVLPVTVAES